MHHTFTQTELQHYSRHFSLPEIGMEGQQRLNAARVLYIGAGGLGSAALAYLAAAGIGTLGIVDDDVIDVSNLQRQILYSYDDVGKSKVIIAKERLQKINPHIQIHIYPERLTEINAMTLLEQYDVILDGSDNFATRYLINDICFQLKKPYIFASISQFVGHCAIIQPDVGPCLRCLFEENSQNNILNCAQAGVLGVLPGILGSIQAAETIKFLLNIGTSLLNKLLVVEVLKMDFRILNISINSACQLSHQEQNKSVDSPVNIPLNITAKELYELQQQKIEFELLDVREPEEYARYHLGGKLIPLKTLVNRLSELDKNKNIIVHCHGEGRSIQAMHLLKANGFKQVRYLSGGVIAWDKMLKNL